MQDMSGTGMAFLEIDGNKIEKNLAPGEVLKVDTGNVVAFEKTVKYEVETVKGLKNIFFGGEGLFLVSRICFKTLKIIITMILYIKIGLVNIQINLVQKGLSH